MSSRDILTEIDDVITWYGSQDSMTWTAEPPRPPAMASIDVERLQQASLIFGEHMRTYLNAMTPAFEQAMRNVGEAFKALARIAPQMQEVAEADRQLRSTMKSKYARRRRRRTGRR
ncbi:hypothetical protein ACNF49_14045 [Actinomadura sp. ATCC 39365]